MSLKTLLGIMLIGMPVILSLGCSASLTPTAPDHTPAPVPSFTATPTMLTSTPTPSPTPNPTSTPVPTPSPTATLTPTPAPTPTSSPTSAPTPTPTLPSTPTASPDSEPITTPLPTPSPSSRPTPTSTPTPSSTPSPTHTPFPTLTPPPSPEPTPTPTLQPTPTAPLTPTTLPTPDSRIDCVFFDGQLSSAEPDEYVQITNHGQTSQELLGWELHHEAFSTRSFTSPSYLLMAGETIRVYTNGEEVPEYEEWGGFSFGRGSAVWSNTTAATAVLRNEAEETVSEKTYDVNSPPGCLD